MTDLQLALSVIPGSKNLFDQAERVVAAVDSNSGPGSARVDNILTTSTPGSSPRVHFRKFLLKPPAWFQAVLVWEVVYQILLILLAVPALLRNDPAYPVELASLGCLDCRAENDMFDRAAERSGAHK